MVRGALGKSYSDGEEIIRQGNVGESMYVVQSGRVEVIQSTPGGETQHLAFLEAGDFFGEMALLRSQRRSATIIASSYCHLYMLSRDAFERVTRDHPLFAARLDDIAAEREQELSGEYVIQPEKETPSSI